MNSECFGEVSKSDNYCDSCDHNGSKESDFADETALLLLTSVLSNLGFDRLGQNARDVVVLRWDGCSVIAIGLGRLLLSRICDYTLAA